MLRNKKVFQISLTVSLAIFILLEKFAITFLGGVSYGASNIDNAMGSRIAYVSQTLSTYKTLLNVGLIAVFFIIWVVLYFLFFKWWKYNEKSTLVITQTILFGTVFWIYGGLRTDYSNYGFADLNLSFYNSFWLLMLAIVATLFVYCEYGNRIALQKKHQIAEEFIIVPIIAFQFIGKPLFMPAGIHAWNITPLTIALFISFTMWLTPVINAIVALCTSAKFHTAYDDGSAKNSRLILFISSLIGYSLYLIACNPCSMSTDAVVAWQEIVGDAKLTSLFPAFIKLAYRVIYQICPTVYIVTVVQVILVSLLCSAFSQYIYEKKVISLKKTAFLTFMFSIFPTNGLFAVSFTSNFYYMVSMCALTLLLIRFVENSDIFIEKKMNLIKVGLCLFCIYFTRNEGKYISCVLAILVGIIFTRKTLKSTLIIAISMALPLILVQFVIFPAAKVQTGIVESNSYISSTNWSIAYYGGDLGEETKLYNSSYEGFNEGEYNPYTCPDKTLNTDLIQKTFLYGLKHNVPEFIRDRFNRSDNVWDITNAENVHNAREITGIVDNEYRIIRHENILTILFVKLLYPITIAIPVLDVVLYRSGIWIAMALVYIFILIISGRKKEMLPLVPCLLHGLFFWFGLIWQCSRHIYVIQLCILMVLLADYFRNTGKLSHEVSQSEVINNTIQ